MTNLEVSEQERQLIEILRQWAGDAEYQIEIKRENGVWELKLSEPRAGRWARGVGRTFAEAWDHIDPSWAWEVAMALTLKRIDKLCKEPGRHFDAHGLYLQVPEPGQKQPRTHRASWLLRYELNGRERWMGLGPAGDFTLDEARARARQGLGLITTRSPRGSVEARFR
jgi:Arm DNA-binding domain